MEEKYLRDGLNKKSLNLLKKNKRKNSQYLIDEKNILN